MTKNMHYNSITAFNMLGDKERRKAAILRVLRQHCPRTNRQIADALGFSDMNMVRPRIFDLVREGKIVELPKVMCEVTKRPVMRVTLQGELFT